MGSESRSSQVSASSPASSSSPSGKRSRDPEDEVYLDNLRSQKRYLSEIMACSLNGLKVGDSLPVNMMETSRPESFPYHSRDDLSLQYSPMSEDSDDARFCEDPTTTSTCSSQPDSRPTSPVSPHRYPRPLAATNPSHPSTSSHYSMSATAITTVASTSTSATTLPRQRGSDTEGRFPSSPSDICHSGDLRRTALLRSVQMRTQPCGSSNSNSVPSIEGEERMCCNKSMDEDRSYRGEEVSYRGEASTDIQPSKSKSCKSLDMAMKGETDEALDYN